MPRRGTKKQKKTKNKKNETQTKVRMALQSSYTEVGTRSLHKVDTTKILRLTEASLWAWPTRLVRGLEIKLPDNHPGIR